MNRIALSVGSADAEKIAECIRNIAEGVSESDIVEIVLRQTESKPEPTNTAEAVAMTSKEVAEALGKPHSFIFKKIARFLCADAGKEQASWFRMASFKIPQGQTYPMYEISEQGCWLYYKWMESYSGYKSTADGLERLKKAIQERFHPEQISRPESSTSDFLLEGKPKSDYETYRSMFNQFITGPAMEGREIAELTEKYRQFYDVMKQTQLKARESNRIEDALFGVAIEAEMQGFIYGCKLFDALLSKQLAVAI